MSNSRLIDNSNDKYIAKCGICWSSIFSGATAAVTVSMILFALGSGLGFLAASPWSGEGLSAGKIAVGTIIWLILLQVISAAFGGYLTGRVRGKRPGIQEDEIYFRDTANGFMSWVVATIFTACFFTSAISYVVGGGMTAAGAGMALQNSNAPKSHYAKYVDGLFRSDTSTKEITHSTRMETSRIIMNEVKSDEGSVEDKKHLVNLVARNTDLSLEDAAKRVDDVILTAKTAADKARKAAATFSILMCIAMLASAFIASKAGVMGGKHRDRY